MILFPSSLLTIPQQGGKHSTYVLDLLGLGEIRGKTGREIFKT